MKEQELRSILSSFIKDEGIARTEDLDGINDTLHAHEQRFTESEKKFAQDGRCDPWRPPPAASKHWESQPHERGKRQLSGMSSTLGTLVRDRARTGASGT